MIEWSWKEKTGKITFKNREGKKYNVNIYDGNCLGIFIYEYKNEKKEDMYTMFCYWLDKAHAERVAANYPDKQLFNDEIVKVELNLAYDHNRTLMNIFLNKGYRVVVYKKDIRKK